MGSWVLDPARTRPPAEFGEVARDLEIAADGSFTLDCTDKFGGSTSSGSWVLEEREMTLMIGWRNGRAMEPPDKMVGLWDGEVIQVGIPALVVFVRPD